MAYKGRIVETKSGIIGKTIFKEKKINKKVVVHLDDKKMLCDQKSLKYIGYY